MMYLAGFDVSTLSLGTLTIATGGESDAVVTLASVTTTRIDSAGSTSLFFPTGNQLVFSITSEDSAAATRLGSFGQRGWINALQGALQAAAATASWADWTDISLVFNANTGLVTADFSAVWSLTWTAAAGRAICGFSGNQSGAATYVGSVVPTYCIKTTLSASSHSTPNFEPSNVANHIVSDNGQGFGVSRYVAPLCRDWVQEWETPEKTERLRAESTHPFTFEHLVQHCRGEYPFAVASGGFGNDSITEVFSLRTDGTSWNPQRASPDSGVAFHLPFKTYVEGYIPAEGA